MGDEDQQPSPTPERFERRVEGDTHAKRGALEAEQQPIVITPAEAPIGPPQAQLDAAAPAGDTPTE